MKKFFPAVVGFITIFAVIFMVGGAVNGLSKNYKPVSMKNKVDIPLHVDYRNIPKGRNRKVLLTDTKFYFTSYDSKNGKGDCETPYVCDLKTGKIERMLNFDVGDVYNFCVYGDCIYFTCYCDTGYDTDANWGYCLIEYCMQNGFTHRIYETPNTVQDISFVISGDKLIYTCGDCDQDGEFDDYQLRIYDLKTEKEHILKKKVPYPRLYQAKNGAYFVYDTDDDSFSFYVEKNGTITSSYFDEDAYYEVDKKHIRINDKLISADFGEYLVLEDDMPDSSFVKNDCGYSYKIKYYLYEHKTQKTTPLVKAKYWFYYV